MKDVLEKKIVMLAQQGKAKVALKKLKKTFKHSPEEELWLKLGDACGRLGNDKEHMQCCAASIQVNPQYAPAYSHAAILQLDVGQKNDALNLIQKALELNNNDADILFNAGTILRRLERYADAIPYFQRCINIAPDHALAHSLCGHCFHTTGDTLQAVFHYKESLQYNPRLEKSLLWLSTHHLGIGEFKDANRCLTKALKISPKSALLLSAHANLLSMMKEKESAYQIVRKLIDSNQITAVSLNVYFDLCPQYGELSEFLSLAENYLQRTTASNPDKQVVQFALAKAYDSIGEYDRAFEHLEISNNLHFSKFNVESYRDMTDKIINAYSHKYIDTMPKNKDIKESPIFLVGMPRSGSTLIEQILSRHSKIFPGGELPYINDAVRRNFLMPSDNSINFEGLKDLKEQDFEAMANEYMKKMEALSGRTIRTTDKMPTNYLYIGLIVQMFPNAKIIHCHRHPLDTCISIYFQDFTIFNPYSSSLTDTANVYREYDRLMKHWQVALNDNILSIGYEDIVADLESTTRSLLDFCELDWEEDCLDFYKGKRKVATASFNQVNQPIYTKSISRWKNYASHTREIEDILKSLI